MTHPQAVWILGEQRAGAIHPVSYELLAWGRSLADDLGVALECIIAGYEISEDVSQLIAHGADRVRYLDHRDLAVFRVDPYARLIERLIREHQP